MRRKTGVSGQVRCALTVTSGAFALFLGITASAAGMGEDALSGARHDYNKYCASCHGAEGRGDGPVAQAMKVMPADITLLAMNNNGEFPADKVRGIIDGRADVKAHGTRAMPVWGQEFYVSAEGVGQRQAKDRVDALTEYLRRMQTTQK